jgi:hypothetical protein
MVTGFTISNPTMRYDASMGSKCRGAYLFCFVALAISSIAASPQSDAALSCKQFAQSFYTWYVPLTQTTLDHPPFETALERKAAVFAPELLQALRADAQAQRRAKGEIVGIDFDPFVGGQDPADHYDTRNMTLRADKCVIEVWRDSPNDTSAKSNQPDVVAELSKRAGRWQFTNFRYPSVNANLIAVLSSLRKERSRPR